MAKALIGAIDLSEQDAKLRSILDRRESLLKSLSGPIRQAQQALARFGETGTSAQCYQTVEATELPSLTADFEKRLSSFADLERQLVSIRDKRGNPDGPDQMTRLHALNEKLTQLRQSRLSNDALSRWAPEGYYAILEDLEGVISPPRRLRGDSHRFSADSVGSPV